MKRLYLKDTYSTSEAGLYQNAKTLNQFQLNKFFKQSVVNILSLLNEKKKKKSLHILQIQTCLG